MLAMGLGCYRPQLIDCVSACDTRLDAQECPGGMFCSNGLCTRQLVCPRPRTGPAISNSCLAGALRCRDGQVQRCDQNAAWQVDRSCVEPEAVCFAASCMACVAASARCFDPESVERCSTLGAWSPPAKCQAPAQCGGGRCVGAQGLLSLSAGEGHTCAVIGDGVKCWGDNSHGQLGVGDRNPRGIVPTHLGDSLPAVALAPGDKVTTVAAGGGHSCVLLATGQVKCWGDNSYGQLGAGDRRPRGHFRDDLGVALPAVKLPEGSVATAISAGRAHTCALLASAEVICWGDNRFGQLGAGDLMTHGTGESATNNLIAVNLGVGLGAVAISTGANHSCALLNSGAVKCWGGNDQGELGQGDDRARGGVFGELGDQLPPVDLGPGRTAVAVSAGGFHTCALLENGSMKCWGANFAGQLGIGVAGNRGTSLSELGAGLPTIDLGPGRTAAAVVAGGAHTCALLTDGLVKCWGANIHGQLGQGDVRNRGTAAGEVGNQAPLDLGTSAAEPLRTSLITSASNHTCALLMNGEAKCWGLNAAGQLGQGDTNHRGDAAEELGDNLRAIRLTGAAMP